MCVLFYNDICIDINNFRSQKNARKIITSSASVETVPRLKFCKLGCKCEIPPAVKSIPYLIICTVFQTILSIWITLKLHTVCLEVRATCVL